MRTVVLDPLPYEVERLIERRRKLGQDTYDEVWECVYHMAPAAHPHHGYLEDEIAAALRPHAMRAGLVGSGPFNLGEPDDYRVPDRGYHRSLPTTTWVPAAAVVVEIVSPGDETWDKLTFYAAHGVDEVLIVEPGEHRVRGMALSEDHYEETGRSAVLGVDMGEIESALRWPA